MIRINKLDDMRHIREDPELWREVYGYMCVCLAEISEYADEVDLEECDLSFLVAAEPDIADVQTLGEPEEIATVDIRCDPARRQLRRMVYTTEVVFIDEKVASQHFGEAD